MKGILPCNSFFYYFFLHFYLFFSSFHNIHIFPYGPGWRMSLPLLVITDSIFLSLSLCFFPFNFITAALLYLLSVVMSLILFLISSGLLSLQQSNNIKHSRSQSRIIRCEISKAESRHLSSWLQNTSRVMGWLGCGLGHRWGKDGHSSRSRAYGHGPNLKTLAVDAQLSLLSLVVKKTEISSSCRHYTSLFLIVRQTNVRNLKHWYFNYDVMEFPKVPILPYNSLAIDKKLTNCNHYKLYALTLSWRKIYRQMVQN